MKPLVVGIVFVSAVGVLIWQVITSAIPVLPMHQLFAAEYQGGRVQVDNGEVVSIEKKGPLEFTVGLKNNPTVRIPVVSTQPMPENFKPGIPVSLRGEYDRESRVFHAYKVTTQCPSRYEATAEAYKNSGATEFKGGDIYKEGAERIDGTPVPVDS